jgi:hypothetical protein
MTNSGESLVDVCIWERNTLSLTLLTWNVHFISVFEESDRIANELELTLYHTFFGGKVYEDFTQLRI